MCDFISIHHHSSPEVRLSGNAGPGQPGQLRRCQGPPQPMPRSVTHRCSHHRQCESASQQHEVQVLHTIEQTAFNIQAGKTCKCTLRLCIKQRGQVAAATPLWSKAALQEVLLQPTNACCNSHGQKHLSDPMLPAICLKQLYPNLCQITSSPLCPSSQHPHVPLMCQR